MKKLQSEEMLESHRNGKRMAGLVVVIVGAVLLCRQMGVILPDWLLSWPMLLIAIGLYIGVKHQFTKPSWWILCLIGGVFLADDIVVGIDIMHFFWPVFIIAMGLYMIFGRKGKWDREWQKERWQGVADEINKAAYDKAEYNTEDYLDNVAIFGSIKKNIISKDFKGGDVVCIFSGAEINLIQAEIKGRVVVEIVNVFGGTTLVVPANWEVKSEMVAILGGIEDKRIQQAIVPDGMNVLVLRGTTVLGGLEITSF